MSDTIKNNMDSNKTRWQQNKLVNKNILLSKNQARKITGSGEYNVGKHYLKKQINEWVVAKYITVIKNSQNNSLIKYQTATKRAFILESSACLTIETILNNPDTGISEHNIVVANPDIQVVHEIKKKYPGVTLFQTTSHEFFKPNNTDNNSNNSNKRNQYKKGNQESTSSPGIATIITEKREDDGYLHNKVKLEGGKRSENFDFCWLDYCGTINSRAGRRRKEDISNIFSNDLLSPSSTLAITLSQRGSPIYYENEIIDSIVSHVYFESSKSSYGTMHCIGVAKYVIKSKMNTILFSKKQFAELIPTRSLSFASNLNDSSIKHTPAIDNIIIIPENEINHDDDDNNNNNNKERKRKLIKSYENITFHDTWKLFQLNKLQSTKLFNACIYISKRLVYLIKTYHILVDDVGNGYDNNNVLVLDNKLIPVASEILTINRKDDKLADRSIDSDKNYHMQRNNLFIVLSNPINDKFIAESIYNSIIAKSSINAKKKNNTSSSTEWCTNISNIRWQDLIMERCNDGINFLKNDSKTNVTRRYRVVWLGYDEVARTGHSLQHCSKWPDIDYLFKKQHFAIHGTFLLGIHIKHSKIGYEYWKDIFIDWVVQGIILVGEKHGVALHCIYGCQYISHSPHMCLIFSGNKNNNDNNKYNDKNGNDNTQSTLVSLLNKTSLPKSFNEFTQWDLNRVKEPCNSSIAKKFRFVSNALMNQLLNDDLGMIDSVLIYEPGNFIIYPNLIKMAKTNQQLKRIYLCSGNDIVQYNEIVNRIISPNRKIGKTDIKIKFTNSSITVSCNAVEDFMINDNNLMVISRLQSIKCIVILVDGGWKRFEEDWLNLVEMWIGSMNLGIDGSDNQYLLMLLISSNGKSDITGTCLQQIFQKFNSNNVKKQNNQKSIVDNCLFHVKHLPKLTTKSESLVYDLWSFHLEVKKTC